MIAALLGSILSDGGATRVPVASVRSAGFAPSGLPAVTEAVEAMRRRGLDISTHRSDRLDIGHLEAADLILTAERDHVVRVASLLPTAFRRSMTMPEFVDRAANASAEPERVGRSSRLVGAVTSMTASRTPQTYLADDVAEVADPTGLPSRDFEAAVTQIERLCRDVGAIILSWVPHGH